MPDHPPEPGRVEPERPASPDVRAATRRTCPRCGAPLGALSRQAAGAAESLYCGCCGLVLPAA